MRAKTSSGPGGSAMALGDASRSFVAGATAGMLSKTLTAPLARLTILRQATAADPKANIQSMRAELGDLWRRGGVVQMFRGNAAAVIHRVPFSGMYHGTYSCLRSSQAPGKEAFGTKLFNGSVAGATACTFAYPLDLARSLIASGKSASPRISHALLNEAKRGGPVALYRGLCSTLLTVTPNLGVNYAVYDSVSQSQMAADVLGSGVCVTLASAASAGIGSSLVTHPLDVVRRVIQLDGANGAVEKFSGKPWISVFMHIASTSPGALWRGLAPELTKVVPSVCLTFTTFEFMKSYVLAS
eukprot:TRINITY_DN15744_c1_g1_i1.p1 TRINITY_DN15744_c1_g1~~TRINITY_DN15744_c1_g1_i1.p1  ORF type:complete len:299 (+),score=67.87 TRINITY_DN15744_c1_g1_i1:233-1129(+)